MKKILIAIPSDEHPDHEFVQSLLALRPVGQIEIKFQAGSLVYLSREILAAYAINNNFDYVLWLDDDMVFKPDLLEKLIEDDVDVAAGLFVQRRYPYEPAIWKDIVCGDEGRYDEKYLDYPENELFEIDACGMAAVLVKGEVLKTVSETYHRTYEPISGYGEDISFCIRAKNSGYKLWCDSRVKVGHVGRYIFTDDTYKAVRAMRGLDKKE